MKLKVIYEPAGRAREYAPLACNPWIGCTGGCVYCYAKHMSRKTAEEFHGQPTLRNDILMKFGEDCRSLYKAEDDRVIFLSFMCDPFQRFLTSESALIYRMLAIAQFFGRKVRTLTKVPNNVEWDEITAPIDYGVTISAGNGRCYELEPKTDRYIDRMESLIEAKTHGHTTWISMEPVLDPASCLETISKWQGIVDFWRIGKLNARDSAMKKIEHSIDWKAFGKAVRDILPPEKYMLKEDLLREMGEL